MTRQRKALAALAVAASVVALGFLSSANLASLAWSHHLLAGWAPADFPGVVLRDTLGADSPLPQAVLAGGPANPLAPAETYRQRAMLALDAGQSEAASANLAHALALADTSNRRMIYESVLAYGEHAGAVGRAAQAQAAFTLLTRLVPERAAAYVRLGEGLRGARRYPDAVAALQQGLATPDHGPDGAVEHARAAYWLGVLYGALGQPDAARAAFQAAIQADPRNTGWWWSWGAYMALGDAAAAQADHAAAAGWYRQAQATAVTAEQVDRARARLKTVQP